MFKSIKASLISTLLLSLLCCGIYPALVYGLGQILFPGAANGSLIYQGNRVIGSRLIGQSFTLPQYFHGRPSSAGDRGYDATLSSGSNLGPTNQKMADQLQHNVDAFLKENPTVPRGQVPTNIVTGSASGLDPHITLDSARAQIERVAAARHLSGHEIKQLIDAHTENALFGILGSPVVNVLLLNLALDQIGKTP